jgi:hypothetical protein
MAELGQTNDPKALIPGDVGAVADTMWQLRTYGDSLYEAGTGLQRVDTTAGWSGPASDAFRKVFQGQPGKWTQAGDCFHAAANALDTYDSTLQWAQQQAADAINLWNQGQAATAAAKADHDRAVAQAQQQAQERTAAGTPTTAPNIPFVDPGEAKRQAAQQMLQRAQAQLKSAGDTAEAAVGKARDQAPPKPGFWSRLGTDISGFFDAAGHDLEVVGADAVNGVASLGNAMINHPGDVAGALGGIGLTVVSGFGDAAGGVLDATGVGAIVGVPVNALSTAGVITGAGITTAAVGDLMHHAMSDDQVSPMKVDSSSGSGDPGPSKTDRLKEHLTDRDLDAARRELDGEVVATKSDGTPWDHVDEVQNAQRGLVNRINQLKRQLGDSRISDADRSSINSELSEASRLLDYSEGFVPRN